jgi:predicted nucleic acid-binding protein
MKPVLVDSNVLLDIATSDPDWCRWSEERIEELANESILVINPIIFGEVSVGFTRIEDLDAALPTEIFRRDPIPLEAAFLAGKCFLEYRRAAGSKRSPLPDFIIGAHAAISGFRLLTRNARRYRTYFPGVDVIAP